MRRGGPVQNPAMPKSSGFRELTVGWPNDDGSGAAESRIPPVVLWASGVVNRELAWLK